MINRLLSIRIPLKYSKQSVVVCALFFIYPIISLPLLYQEMLNKKRYAFVLFCLFLAILGYITIPDFESDLTRHYETYQTLSRYSFSEFIHFLSMKLDVIFYLFTFGIAKLGLSRQFIPFTAVLLSFSLMFSILVSECKKQNFSKASIAIFIILFFCVTDIRSSILGIRNVAAVSLFTYGSYRVLHGRSFRGWIYIVFAVATHFMILPLIPLLFLAKFRIITRVPKILFLLGFVSLFIPSEWIYGIFKYLDALLLDGRYSDSIKIYTIGYWGNKYLEYASLKGLIFDRVQKIPFFVLLGYLLFYSRTSSNQLRVFVCLSVLFTMFLFNISNLFGRYSLISTSLLIVLLCVDYKNHPLKQKALYIKVLACLYVISFAMNVYAMLKHEGGYQKVLYNAYPTLFLYKVEEDMYIKD